MSSLPLFDRFQRDDITASRHRGNAQSEAAHEQTKESHEAMRARILTYLEWRGRYGATWSEISEALGIPYSNSGRCSQLKAAGLIIASGCVRPTPSGCNAAVLVMKEFHDEQA